MDVILLQSAQADLLELFCRHGEASYRAVDEALESIRRMPESGPVYHNRFRRKLFAETPFGIFYSIEGRG